MQIHITFRVGDKKILQLMISQAYTKVTPVKTTKTTIADYSQMR